MTTVLIVMLKKQILMKQQTMTIQPRETKMNAIQTTRYSDNTIYVSNHTSMNQLHYLKTELTLSYHHHSQSLNNATPSSVLPNTEEYNSNTSKYNFLAYSLLY